MRDVIGFEGLYAVTSCGRVWSYRSNKFLKPQKDKDGYLFVALCVDGQHNPRRIHRIVAETYIPNPNNLPEVNHKDEIKDHNWINNLEWCDRKYNIRYGTGIKRSKEAISHKVRCVETGEEFRSIMDCERKIGVNHGNLSQHLRGLRGCVNGLHFERIDCNEKN